MRKIAVLLILLGFFILRISLFAQDIPFSVKVNNPTEDYDANPDSRFNLDSWEFDKKVKRNFVPLHTVPFYSTDKIDVEFGPAQFLIRIPI